MEIEGDVSGQSVSAESPLSDAFDRVNHRRIDIDLRMGLLAPEDPERDRLWCELESLQADLCDIIRRLARTPATGSSELLAKSAILAGLLRSDLPEGGPAIPEAERTALALSVTEDIARLLDS